MRNYYFVAASLPPLFIHERPEMTFEELTLRLEINLARADLEKTRVLRRIVDIFNIRSLLMEESVDRRGNLNEKELDEALLVQAVLPAYVFEFLDQFEKVSDKIRNFSGLLAQVFNSEIPRHKGFLRDYLLFEREYRLVLSALRSKQTGRDIAQELQFEDPTEPFVAQILAQKDSGSYDPPAEYADLKELIASSYADPWLEHQAFAAYRFKKIGELAEKKLFSIDQILCYMVQLMIVESLFELDEQRGNMILDTFKSG
jgi:hypothetical protein